MTKDTAKVVVVGSCMIDLTCYADRLPKPGETIHGKEFKKDTGGKGANQCVAASRLGASAALIARLGDDVFGAEYLESLKKQCINTEHVNLTKGVSCGIAQITVAADGENQIIIVSGANAQLSVNDVREASDLIANAAVVVCQFETPLESTIAALEIVRANKNGISIVNAAPAFPNADRRVYTLADIFCVNEIEAGMMTGLSTGTVEECKAALSTLLNFGCKCVILTMGKNGALFATEDDPLPVHEPGDPIEKPADTTGAGDAFIGALAFLLANYSSMSLKKQIKIACLIARESCMKQGTQASFSNIQDLPAQWFKE